MRIPLGVFRGTLPLTYRVSRSGRLSWLSRPVMRGIARLNLWVSGGRRVDGAESVGAEWHRMFPKHIEMPITRIEGETVYAEIHEACPFRGTGDVEGCHRMMEFDRRLLETIGGQLVVLHSQAEPGRSHCELAIRPSGASLEGLEHARDRVRRGG